MGYRISQRHERPCVLGGQTTLTAPPCCSLRGFPQVRSWPMGFGRLALSLEDTTLRADEVQTRQARRKPNKKNRGRSPSSSPTPWTLSREPASREWAKDRHRMHVLRTESFSGCPRSAAVLGLERNARWMPQDFLLGKGARV